MKFIGETFAYLKKSFWLLAAVIAVPSIAACFLSTPYWEVSFVTTIDRPVMTASETFGIIFGDSWHHFWPVIVISALQIFSSAYVMSAIDRHFRTGKLSLRSPWRLINYSVFSIFLGIAIMCVMAVVLRFVLFGLVMLVQVIAQSAGFSSGATLAVISFIAVGLFVVHVVIITPMLYLAPIMFIYGYGFRDAAGMSFKLISGKKVFVGLILPMILCAGIQLLIGFLNLHVSIMIVCNFVIYLVTNVYVVAYVVVTFYKISGLDRRDVKPYASFVLPPVAPVKKADDTVSNAQTAETESTKADETDKKSPKQAPKKSDGASSRKGSGGKQSEKTTKSKGKSGKAPAEKTGKTAKQGKNSTANSSEKSDKLSEKGVTADATSEGGEDGV